MEESAPGVFHILSQGAIFLSGQQLTVKLSLRYFFVLAWSVSLSVLGRGGGRKCVASAFLIYIYSWFREEKVGQEGQLSNGGSFDKENSFPEAGAASPASEQTAVPVPAVPSKRGYADALCRNIGSSQPPRAVQVIQFSYTYKECLLDSVS